MTDLEIGFLLGLLHAEAHFGGDGKNPQITLRRHVRHERTFRWLTRHLPGSKLYGPYHHAGRHYYQWMVRGWYLRQVVAPVIFRNLELFDDHVAERFRKMCADYSIDPSALPAFEVSGGAELPPTGSGLSNTDDGSSAGAERSGNRMR